MGYLANWPRYLHNRTPLGPKLVLKNPRLFNNLSKLFRDVKCWSAHTQNNVETLFLGERANPQLFWTPKNFEIDALFVMLEGFLYWSQVLELSHAYLRHTCMHILSYMPWFAIYACMYASNTREMTPKLDFNTKILLTSRIMHRFQRFLVFWKAEGLLFHLETTFPRSFVFVHSKTWQLWKVSLIYWINGGSSIATLVKYLSQNTGNTHFQK